MFLVIGATGQLGSRVVNKLLSAGQPVRVMVRSEEAVRRFEALGCEAYRGDITRPGEAKGPLPQVHTIIATANAAVPSRPGDSIQKVDVAGYRNLIAAAQEAGWVKRFVYVSICECEGVERVPLFAAKRANERQLAASGLGYTILRFPAFMDTTIPMMGYTAPLAEEEMATLRRGFSAKALKQAEETLAKGRIRIVRGKAAQPYIAIEDVAELVVAAAVRPEAHNRTLEITGPEALTSEQVAELIEERVGQKLGRDATPAWVLGLLSKLLGLFNPALGNILAIQHLSATSGTPVRGQELAAEWGVRLRTVREYLAGASRAA